MARTLALCAEPATLLAWCWLRLERPHVGGGTALFLIALAILPAPLPRRRRLAGDAAQRTGQPPPRRDPARADPDATRQPRRPRPSAAARRRGARRSRRRRGGVRRLQLLRRRQWPGPALAELGLLQQARE